MTTETLIVIVIAAAVALLLIVAFASRSSKSRQQRLRERFGPEYDRALERHGSERKVERELAARERRVERLHINELDAAHRVQFRTSWGHAQTLFVDDPSAAVHEANELIKTVMRARGYPVEDFERRVEDLSVDHANVIDHYRAARVLAEANREGRANTEELRQAFVHYRALFAELLEEPHTVAPTLDSRADARGVH
jgi:hypothetical protein